MATGDAIMDECNFAGLAYHSSIVDYVSLCMQVEELTLGFRRLHWIITETALRDRQIPRELILLLESCLVPEESRQL